MKTIEFIDRKIEEIISDFFSGKIKSEEELVKRIREEEGYSSSLLFYFLVQRFFKKLDENGIGIKSLLLMKYYLRSPYEEEKMVIDFEFSPTFPKEIICIVKPNPFLKNLLRISAWRSAIAFIYYNMREYEEKIKNAAKEGKKTIYIADIEEELISKADYNKFIPVRETPILYLSFSFDEQKFNNFKNLIEVENVLQKELMV